MHCVASLPIKVMLLPHQNMVPMAAPVSHGAAPGPCPGEFWNHVAKLRSLTKRLMRSTPDLNESLNTSST